MHNISFEGEDFYIAKSRRRYWRTEEKIESQVLLGFINIDIVFVNLFL